MLRKLGDFDTVFARSLRHHLCIRLLQRRTVASRMARFLHDKQEETLLDSYLEAFREATLEAENDQLLATFQASGELADVIARFSGQRPRKRARTLRNTATDDYDEFLAAAEQADPETAFEDEERPSLKVLMDLHLRGYSTLPRYLIEVMDTLQPTSVPSERAFSKARHARRFCQERQHDERFTDYLLLGDFYRHNEPLRPFAIERGILAAPPSPEPEADEASAPRDTNANVGA